MASTTEHDMTPERFAALADTFGGDLARWPAAEREAARAFAGRDLLASRRLTEAAALDRLLGAAPAGAVTPALVDRIVASAAASPRLAGPATTPAPARGMVVALPPAKSATAFPPSSTVPMSRPRDTAGGGWRFHRGQAAGAGGMLAASLLLGIWLGASGMTSAFGPALTARSGISDFEAISEIVQSALPADLLDDEDTL